MTLKGPYHLDKIYDDGKIKPSRYKVKVIILNPFYRQIADFTDNIREQAGTVLGQAQLKLELYFTSFKICCIKLVKLDKLC